MPPLLHTHMSPHVLLQCSRGAGYKASKTTNITSRAVRKATGCVAIAHSISFRHGIPHAMMSVPNTKPTMQSAGECTPRYRRDKVTLTSHRHASAEAGTSGAMPSLTR